MQYQPSLDYALLKFSPSEVTLLELATTKVYRYFEECRADKFPDATHPSLLRPRCISNGIIYPKEISTLAVQIENRNRAYSKIRFTEEQLLNTFLPLFECLQSLHSKGIIHGEISPQAIVIDDQEEVKLRDWLVPNKNREMYFGKEREAVVASDDVVALGQILVICALVRPQNEVVTKLEQNQVFQSLMDNYSKTIVCAIIGMLQRSATGANLIKILKNEHQEKDFKAISEVYEKMKFQKEKKLLVIDQKTNISSPIRKKFNITKRTLKYDNSENKIQARKDKPSRMMQKTNAFPQQFVTRKINNDVPNEEEKRRTYRHVTTNKAVIIDIENKKFNRMENPSSIWKVRAQSKKK